MKGSLLAHMLDPYLINRIFSYSVKHLFLLSFIAGFSRFQVGFGWRNMDCPIW